MPASRTPEHDVARTISIEIGVDDPQTDEQGFAIQRLRIIESHLHVGADLRSQTNEEAGKWIKAIIDRVVKKELET